MNEYSPVDAANSHWRRRTRPPASRLAPTTRVSPLLPPFSFLLPTTFAVFINYAPLSSSLRRENTSLSLFQLLPLHISPSLFHPFVLFYRSHISHIHPSFFIGLFFSRVRLTLSFSLSRAPPRIRASSSLQRSRMIDASECTRPLTYEHAHRDEAVPSFGRFVHSCLDHTFQQCSLPG